VDPSLFFSPKGGAGPAGKQRARAPFFTGWGAHIGVRRIREHLRPFNNRAGAPNKNCSHVPGAGSWVAGKHRFFYDLGRAVLRVRLEADCPYTGNIHKTRDVRRGGPRRFPAISCRPSKGGSIGDRPTSAGRLGYPVASRVLVYATGGLGPWAKRKVRHPFKTSPPRLPNTNVPAVISQKHRCFCVAASDSSYRAGRLEPRGGAGVAHAMWGRGNCLSGGRN